MGGGSLFELIFRNSWLESFHSPRWFRGGFELDVVPDGLEVEVRQLGVRVRVAGDVKGVGIVLPRKIPVSLKVGRCMSLLRRWPTRPRCQRPKVTRWWCQPRVSGATARRAARRRQERASRMENHLLYPEKPGNVGVLALGRDIVGLYASGQ